MDEISKVLREAFKEEIPTNIERAHHQSTLLKLQKTCIDSLKSLGISLRMGNKVITLVNTRNLTTTVTAAAASTKNKREIKYGKSTWI